MANDYSRALIESLGEEQVHGHLLEALRNLEYTVKNVHASDPRHEGGADLVAEKADGNLLIAVKRKPKKADIEQLRRLSHRRHEGQLLYMHMTSPTEPFRAAMKRFKTKVKFVGPPELHTFLLQGGSVGYIQSLFGMHLITREFSDAISCMWFCKDVSFSGDPRQAEDLRTLWRLKDAVLKVRAAAGAMAVRWEDNLLSLTSWEPNRFEGLLDNVFAELDQIQRFCGGGLALTFKDAMMNRPHVLARLWSIMRGRTYWNEFMGAAEKLDTMQKVSEFSRLYWALPGEGSLGHTRFVKPQMKGFYSAVAGLVRSLARATKDLDDGLDMLWSTSTEVDH